MSALSTKHLQQAMLNRPAPPAPWDFFPFLDRYYGGIRTLSAKQSNDPEYPVDGGAVDANRTYAEKIKDVPLSKMVDPYPSYQTADYQSKYGIVHECFLDEEEQVKVPRVHAYTGVTEGFPEAAMGSYEVLGLEDGVCYDRYGKLGPYGYGYSLKKGGIGAGLDGEKQGADVVFKESGQIDYRKVKWGKMQKRCVEKNKDRFDSVSGASGESFRAMPGARSENSTRSQDSTSNSKPLSETKHKVPRAAVLIRTWRDFKYTTDAIMYLRGMIAELSLLSGGEYTVHFLIHVKDDNRPIWSDEGIYNQTLKEALPAEFEGMGTLWSERQMGLIYGGLQESFYRNLPVHGVYRSAHLPLQWFAHNHPEYEFYWNWEMDVRYTGQWYKLFSSLSKFAEQQPRKGLWERNGRFYVPSVHGSWDDFKHMSRVQSEMPPPQANNKWANAGPPDAESPPDGTEQSVWGPLAPADTVPLDTDPIPPTSYEKDKYEWGVGESADLITLNPMFDPTRTTWLLAEDVTGYNLSEGMPPRRAAIVTASRLSRRLLETMHHETALSRHTMFSEMWPATVSLHHGLKAVYAPHPMFIDRAWPTAYLAKVMNGGLNGAAGGARTSVFGELEHNLRGVTWYYNSGFPSNFWKRWLGYRVDGGGGEQAELDGEGRMCVPGVLLHPVKEIALVVEEPDKKVEVPKGQ